MDRDYRIMKDGYLLAELKFRYSNPSTAKAYITTYRSYDLGDEGAKSVYPMGTYDTYINHRNALKTVEEIKEFDRSFAKSEHQIASEMDGKIEFLYEPIHYRYLIHTHRETIGIADIQADFNENKKELQFISAKKIRDDYPLSSDSCEINLALLKRLSELQWLDFPYADFTEAESWYV